MNKKKILNCVFDARLRILQNVFAMVRNRTHKLHHEFSQNSEKFELVCLLAAIQSNQKEFKYYSCILSTTCLSVMLLKMLFDS